MATRSGYPGTESAADVLTTTNFNKLPGGWIGQVQVTANQTAITTVADLTSLTLSVTYQSGRTYLWLAQIKVQSNTANDYFGLALTDATPTTFTQGLYQTESSANTDTTLSLMFYEVAGSSGSVTRKLRGGRAGGSAGTFQMSASATAPAQLTCIDIGL